jgi:hypothetical protein
MYNNLKEIRNKFLEGNSEEPCLYIYNIQDSKKERQSFTSFSVVNAFKISQRRPPLIMIVRMNVQK